MAEKDTGTKKRLGEILVDMGVLTKDQLEAALKIQKKEDALLGTILIRMEFVSESDITIALAKQNAIPYIPVLQCRIQPSTLKYVDASFAFQNRLIPFDKIENHLLVVFTDPSNSSLIADLEKKAKMRIQVFVGIGNEILQAIKKFYKLDEKGKPR